MGDNCDCEDNCTCGEDCECDDCTCDCDDGGIDMGYLVVGTVGFLLLGLTMIVTALFYLDGVWNFLNLDRGGYDAGKFVLSFVIILLGAYGLKEGIVAETIVLIVTGLSMFIFSFAAIFGIGAAPEFIDLLFGIGLLLSTLIFFLRSEILAGIATLCMAVALIIYSFLSGDAKLIVFGIPALISGIIFTYIAFGNAIFVETGEDYLPLL